MSYSSSGVGVLVLYPLFICLSILRWHIREDDQDLAIWSLQHFSQIVRGDGCVGDLKCVAVRRLLQVDLAAMNRDERSSKLLEHTALASHVFKVLVDGAGVVETPAVSTIWCLGSKFDLDLALHEVIRYMGCVPQANRHAGGGQRGPARAFDAFIDLDCVGEHAFNTIKPRDQIARSGWVAFYKQICPDLLAGGDRVCDNPPRKIPYYHLNQSTLVIKQ
jgi:hypothetical protein